jgi:hypothetical protein
LKYELSIGLSTDTQSFFCNDQPLQMQTLANTSGSATTKDIPFEISHLGCPVPSDESVGEKIEIPA